MKISKIYSNKNNVFSPIEFTDGINIIIGETTDGKTKGKTTHNLGKSTLLELIDFCLFKKHLSDIFLKKHENVFKDYVFFLETQTSKNTYITIRRGVENSSKFSLMIHEKGNQDYSSHPSSEWDFWEVSYEDAKSAYDLYLSWGLPKSISFRRYLMYTMRNQNEYTDVFTFIKGSSKPQVTWKPVASCKLGFNSTAQSSIFNLNEEKEKATDAYKASDMIISNLQIPNAELLRKHLKESLAKIETLKNAVSKCDFTEDDTQQIDKDLPEIDIEISRLNSRIYQLRRNVSILTASLKSQSIPNIDDLESLFNEAKLLFPNEIKKSYSDLIFFNKKVFLERQQLIKGKIAELNKQSNILHAELEEYHKQRNSITIRINNSQFQEKIKAAASSVVDMERECVKLRNKLALYRSRNIAESKINHIKREQQLAKRTFAKSVTDSQHDPSSKFSLIQEKFMQIISNILSANARLLVDVNSVDNVIYDARFYNDDDNPNEQINGNTFKKIACIAFDMSLAYADSERPAPHFIIHDGVFESSEDKIKFLLLDEMSDLCSKGIQYIITMIDSEIPAGLSLEQFIKDKANVVLRLNDNSSDGQLFKGVNW